MLLVTCHLSFIIKKQKEKQSDQELTIHSGMWKAEVPSLPSHFSIVQAWVRLCPEAKGKAGLEMAGLSEGPKADPNLVIQKVNQ